MNIQQLLPTPPSSQTIHYECKNSSASGAGIRNPVFCQRNLDELTLHSSIESQQKLKNGQPSTFKGTIYRQLKLVDLCTQHEGLYFDCDDPAEFWDTIATKVVGHFQPTTGLQVQSWVKAICLERRECLLQGQIPARREESEKLDIAIDAWLQIVGRKILQSALSSIRTGYILTFGPEESDEEHILAKHCRDRLNSNMEYIKMQKTKKFKSNRVTSVRLVQAIESIESQMSGQQTAIQSLTPDQFYGPATTRPHESLSPLLQPDNTTSQTLPPSSSNGGYNTMSSGLDVRDFFALGLRTTPPTRAIPREVAGLNSSISRHAQTTASIPRTLISGERNVQDSGLQRGKNLDNKNRGRVALKDGESSYVQSNRSSDKGTQTEFLEAPAVPSGELSTPNTKTRHHLQSELAQEQASVIHSRGSSLNMLAIPSAAPTVPRTDRPEETPFGDDVSIIDLTQPPTHEPIKEGDIDPEAFKCDVGSPAADMNGVINITLGQLSTTVSEIMSQTIADFEGRASHRIDHIEYHLRRLYEITRRRK